MFDEHATATYNIADNKFRIDFMSRLDDTEYETLTGKGFYWVRGEECFKGVWTPEVEDFLLENGVEIIHVDEDDNVLARVSRYEELAEKAQNRKKAASRAANAATEGIVAGQPVFAGKKGAWHRKALKRGHSAMARWTDEARKVEYWKDRARGSLARAEAREQPGAIKRRIDRLEADLRKYQRASNRPAWDKKNKAWFESQGDDVEAIWENTLTRCNRWIAHLETRLAYEKSLYEESGGLVTDEKKPEKGGLVKTRHGWYGPVIRVNRVTVTVPTRHTWTETIKLDKILDVLPASKVEEYQTRYTPIKKVRPAYHDPDNSVSLFDIARPSIVEGTTFAFCVAAAIHPRQVDDEWNDYLEVLQGARFIECPECGDERALLTQEGTDCPACGPLEFPYIWTKPCEKCKGVVLSSEDGAKCFDCGHSSSLDYAEDVDDQALWVTEPTS
jgi:hypothetical protein